MKKIVAFLFVCALVFSGSALFAQDASMGYFDIKLGTADAKAADDYKKFGFNAAVEGGFFLNPYFALSLNPSFTIIRWKSSGTTSGGALAATAGSTSKNAYLIPVIANAKFFIPESVTGSPVTPYFGGGAGASFMKFDSNWYKGFVWQVLAGAQYKLPDTNMSVLVEGGWRGQTVSDKIDTVKYEINMSGMFANAGVSFAF